jgi:hypothetical protein
MSQLWDQYLQEMWARYTKDTKPSMRVSKEQFYLHLLDWNLRKERENAEHQG